LSGLLNLAAVAPLLPLAESAQFRSLKVPSLEYSPVVVVPLRAGRLGVTDLDDS